MIGAGAGRGGERNTRQTRMVNRSARTTVKRCRQRTKLATGRGGGGAGGPSSSHQVCASLCLVEGEQVGDAERPGHGHVVLEHVALPRLELRGRVGFHHQSDVVHQVVDLFRDICASPDRQRSELLLNLSLSLSLSPLLERRGVAAALLRRQTGASQSSRMAAEHVHGGCGCRCGRGCCLHARWKPESHVHKSCTDTHRGPVRETAWGHGEVTHTTVWSS